MFEAVHGVHMDQSTKSTAESPDAELPSTMIPKRAVETVAEKKKKNRSWLCWAYGCPHLHLVTVTVVLVSSEALRLGGSTIAVSLVWAFAEIYRILDGKPASLPICDHALWHFFCCTFCVRRLKLRSVCGAVDLPPWGYPLTGNIWDAPRLSTSTK